MTHESESLKILVVDDNPENIHILVENLEDDYTVFFATNGKKALEICSSVDKPDLILLDIMMPDMDGYDVCSKLKSSADTRDILVIFITALDRDSDETKGLRVGAVDFITKPFSIDVAKARIKTILHLKEEMDRRISLSHELEVLNDNLEQRVQEKTNELASAYEELKHNHDAQTTINALLNFSLTDTSFTELLQGSLELVLEINWLSLQSRGCIFLADHEQKVLLMTASKGMEKYIKELCSTVPFGKCLCGRAVQFCEIQFASHLDPRHEITYPEIMPHGHYCVPILLADKCIGVLSLYLQDEHGYSPEDDKSLIVIANTLAGIIERRRIIDEKKKLASELRQSQKMEAIGTLAGGIAHDFNNILTAILGYADLAKNELSPESEAAEDIAEVLKAGERAKDLVSQILTFSRQTEPQLKPLAVYKVVKDALKLLRASIPSIIDIRANIDPDSGYAMVDPTQIHQIIMNICTNAYYDMRDIGGTLAVGLSKVDVDEEGCLEKGSNLTPGSYLLIEIKDNGRGMTAATMDRIFEPYFTTKMQGEGTGMGLAVVHGIVESYGGHISVHSQLGEGTAFHVYLPAIAKPIRQTEVKSKHDIPSGSERVLLVDDEEAVVHLLRKMLESLGYKVNSTTSSEAALQIFRAEPNAFDVFITDMTMPGMTGVELIPKILAIRSEIPVVMCSGSRELINEVESRDIGVQGFLVKPVSRADLAVIVRRLLDEG